MVPLGEIAAVNPRSVSAISDATAVSFVGMAQLDAETATAKPSETRVFSEASKGYTIFRDRDILAAKITPCWENGKVGQAHLDHEVGVGSTEFHVIRPNEDQLDPRYLMHFLRQARVREQGTLRMTGSGGQRRVPASFVKDLQIPLPPLDEQRRVAAILDQAEALRAKRRAQLAELDALPQAIFHKMFGQEVSTVPFGSVVELIGGKSIVAPDQDIESDYRVIKISAVTSGTFRPHESKALPVGYVPAPHHLIHEGDVLMSRANTAELVGAVARVTVPTKKLAVPDKVWRFSWKRPDIDPDYFVAALKQPATRRSMSQLASGSGGSMKNISKSKLEGMPVTWVPHLQQRAFASVTSGVQRIRTSVSQEILATDALFTSLQSRAFRGEL